MPTSVSFFRLLLLTLVLCAGLPVQAGESKYIERGKADFDRVLQVLNPYGTWSKIGGRWAYTPTDHNAPYTDGRWLYTEYGWYWKGNAAYSWATDHYGYWKRDATTKIWSWFPGPIWIPVIVEIRETPTHIGWRSGEVDQDGVYVEAPEDRYAKTDEWTFVTRQQFANPITPKIVADPDTAMRQLVNSTDSHHAYFTYRPLDRPGPHPADIAPFCKDGGMLAPKTLEDQLAEQKAAAPPAPVMIPSETGAMPATNAPASATNTAKTTDAATPAAAAGGEDEPAIDMRKVKYWITMSLPTPWTARPADAKPGEVYFFRPDFYQDDDGVQRRITLWFNPLARTSLKDILGTHLPGASSSASNASGGGQAVPARPVHAFSDPLETPYRPSSSSSGASSKAPQGPVPTGLVNAPSGSTNSAPTKP